MNYFTAWRLVVVMGALKANETVLIHSVGGGVGIAATQIAKHVGARVIGTASAGKHEEMRALGVDHLSTIVPRISRHGPAKSPVVAVSS